MQTGTGRIYVTGNRCIYFITRQRRLCELPKSKELPTLLCTRTTLWPETRVLDSWRRRLPAGPEVMVFPPFLCIMTTLWPETRVPDSWWRRVHAGPEVVVFLLFFFFWLRTTLWPETRVLDSWRRRVPAGPEVVVLPPILDAHLCDGRHRCPPHPRPQVCLLQRGRHWYTVPVYHTPTIEEESDRRSSLMFDVLECRTSHLKKYFWKNIMGGFSIFHFSEASLLPSVSSSIHPFIQIIQVLNLKSRPPDSRDDFCLLFGLILFPLHPNFNFLLLTTASKIQRHFLHFKFRREKMLWNLCHRNQTEATLIYVFLKVFCVVNIFQQFF